MNFDQTFQIHHIENQQHTRRFWHCKLDAHCEAPLGNLLVFNMEYAIKLQCKIVFQIGVEHIEYNDVSYFYLYPLIT